MGHVAGLDGGVDGALLIQLIRIELASNDAGVGLALGFGVSARVSADEPLMVLNSCQFFFEGVAAHPAQVLVFDVI